MPAVPFKANAARRHRIPKQRHRVTNWAEYDAALRQRGSLTVWFTEAAIAAWRAEPRTTPGGQPCYSPLAILTALTLRAVFRLALRQTEGLIGSILRLLGLELAVPDHTTLSRRAETLQVPRPRLGHRAAAPAGGQHRPAAGRARRVAGREARHADAPLLAQAAPRRGRRHRPDRGRGADRQRVDDGSQVGPLLDQVTGPVASFTGDGAYDRDDVYGAVAERHPEAAVVVPPRRDAVPSEAAETAPTQRDRHLQPIAERGRMGWQKASGYNRRALAEAAISRYKRVIGDALRSRTDRRQATEVAIAVRALNRMLELGRPESVRIA